MAIYMLTINLLAPYSTLPCCGQMDYCASASRRNSQWSLNLIWVSSTSPKLHFVKVLRKMLIYMGPSVHVIMSSCPVLMIETMVVRYAWTQSALLTVLYISLELLHMQLCNARLLPDKHNLGHVWMCMYSSQSTCVKVDWSEIKLSFIPFHSNTYGLKWIYMHPNKTLVVYSG
jgi:hypothetical protein